MEMWENRFCHLQDGNQGNIRNDVPIVENVPIRMRVIFASQRIEFTAGYRIDVTIWDADKQRVKNGCTNKLKQSAAEINTDLLKYYAEIQNIFKEFEVQEVMPTTQQLKEAFNMRMKGDGYQGKDSPKLYQLHEYERHAESGQFEQLPALMFPPLGKINLTI